MKSKYIIFGLFILLSSCTNERTFVHDYNYKTIIDIRPDKYDYNHFNNKSFDGLCKIRYGFLKNPWLIKAYDTDGTLIARCGPPFTFFIDFNRINQDVEYIKIESIEMVTKNKTFDLLVLKDISIETSISYYGKKKEPNYDPDHTSFWERDDFQTLQQLKDERGINFIRLRSKGFAYFEEWIKKSKYEYNEEEREMLHKEKSFYASLKIKHFPLDVIDDEEVTVNISLIFILSNSSTQRVQFDDIYFREYSEHYYSSPHPFLPKNYNIKLLPEEKDVNN